VLNLDKSNRDDDANKILDDFYDRYRLLFQESNLMKNSFSDKLLKLPPKKKMFNYKKANNTESTISSSSSSSSSVGSEGQSPLNINTDTRYEEVELGKGGISNDYLEEQI
jgi:hypothetical protein